ncbi:MAG TPA: HAMP domain-containing sensor histidine kinase [Polyangia bacterium]|nr:HAMP domain-containing sensor histidine kinase [Polyangia bacterium]
MPLHRFLDENRDAILRRTIGEIAQGSPEGTDDEILDSLPELYEEVIARLRQQAGLPRQTAATAHEEAASAHGLQRLRLGFTITQLVHDYGALCNSITELAKKDGAITAQEFQILNQILDEAIAAAVAGYSSEHELERDRQTNQKATEHLGFVAHELRNAIASAMLAFDALRRGQVGLGGRTSNVLERSLTRLRGLVDRSLSEVRLKSGLTLSPEPTHFRQLLEEVEASATVDAVAKGTRIAIRADPALQGSVDRQLLTSALANFVQNAIKYSPPGAEVEMRCGPSDAGVTIEVEDQCGGLPGGKIDELFSPFVRGRNEGGGLGLGLAIARQAIEAHGGGVHVRNLPGKGCVFVVTLPPRR